MEKHSWAWVSPVREEEGEGVPVCSGLASMGKGRLHQTGLGGREPASLWSEEETGFISRGEGTGGGQTVGKQDTGKTLEKAEQA